MKLNTLPIIVMILTSVMVLPVGLSYAQVSSGTMTNQTSTNETMTNQTSTNGTMTMSSNSTSMNQTMAMPSSNSTSTMNQTVTSPPPVPQTNDTQDAMQVSTFIHQAVSDFAKQGDDTRKVIFDCRDQIQSAAPSDVDSIKNGCATQLNAIKAQYQDERSHYHDLIKQYRQSVMVFLNDARGQSVPQATMASAIAQLAMMMHPASPSMVTNHTTTNNTS
ncbi:MAG TPA: hypothetical protein VFX64_03700 [Candidatus Nitrosotalea sp.]|nr:hypothetical protein [Candidatus Nitrosotalea sp.]